MRIRDLAYGSVLAAIHFILCGILPTVYYALGPSNPIIAEGVLGLYLTLTVPAIAWRAITADALDMDLLPYRELFVSSLCFGVASWACLALVSSKRLKPKSAASAAVLLLAVMAAIGNWLGR